MSVDTIVGWEVVDEVVDDVHIRHVKGPMGALGTQSLVFKDRTTVDLKCKSTLMTFNTKIPTKEEVDNLPKYQISFTDLDLKRYYDDSHVNNHNQSNQDKENIHPNGLKQVDLKLR